MHPQNLSLVARTLYAELRDLALALGAGEHVAAAPGSVVRKTVRHQGYLYYQYRDLSGVTRQAYLGADDAATAGVVERLRERADLRSADLTRLDELRAAFAAAGGLTMAQPPFRVLRAFADAGLLRPGPGSGVLVGTHAFHAIANLLGVRWADGLLTQDLDVAAGRDIDIAVARPDMAPLSILEALGMGFIPVPALDPRAPSTSFRVRGQELRVDLLTPLVGKPTGKTVFVPAFNAPAQPVRFLEYLLEDPVPVPVLSASALALVNVPRPARFALHKVLVAESRGEVFVTRAQKDRQQAAQIIEVLLDEAPDALRSARADLLARGKGWVDRYRRGMRKLAAVDGRFEVLLP